MSHAPLSEEPPEAVEASRITGSQEVGIVESVRRGRARKATGHSAARSSRRCSCSPGSSMYSSARRAPTGRPPPRWLRRKSQPPRRTQKGDRSHHRRRGTRRGTQEPRPRRTRRQPCFGRVSADRRRLEHRRVVGGMRHERHLPPPWQSSGAALTDLASVAPRPPRASDAVLRRPPSTSKDGVSVTHSHWARGSR